MSTRNRNKLVHSVNNGKLNDLIHAKMSIYLVSLSTASITQHKPPWKVLEEVCNKAVRLPGIWCIKPALATRRCRFRLFFFFTLEPS